MEYRIDDKMLKASIFLRNDYRAAYTSRISETRDWKPASPTCQGEHTYHAVFWFTAGN